MSDYQNKNSILGNLKRKRESVLQENTNISNFQNMQVLQNNQNKVIQCDCEKVLKQSHCQTIQLILKHIFQIKTQSQKQTSQIKMTNLQKFKQNIKKFNSSRYIKALIPKSKKEQKKEIDKEKQNLIQMKNSKILISKDSKRTFQNKAYFKEELTQTLLTQNIQKILSNFEDLNYIQGMNFFVGQIMYHTLNQNHTVLIGTFILRKMQVQNIYNLTQIEKYVKVFISLLQKHCGNLYYIIQKNKELNISLCLLDWFITLGTSKIPIQNCSTHLLLLVTDGWNYFYKFLIVVFKTIEKDFANLQEMNIFSLQIFLKSFHLKQKISWECIFLEAKKAKLKSKTLDLITNNQITST